MHKYIFVDTNLFEQYQPIEDIDWLSLANCTSATIVIAPVVLSELNEHKDRGSRGRLKRKATSALSALRTYSIQSTPLIRPLVDLRFRTKEPTIDFAGYQLNDSVNDDRLIASAIEFALEGNLDKATVFIATGDLGLELKTKSQNLVAPLPLPEERRLPQEPDDDEKEIQKLTKQLQQLQAAAPDLFLTFQGGKNFEEFQLSRFEGRSNVEEAVKAERLHYPYLQNTAPQ